MQPYLPLFGPTHLALVAAIAAAAAGLGWWCRRAPSAAPRVRAALGLLILINELVWYGYRYSTEGNRFPEGLPLHLCDLTVWLAAVAALTRRQWAFEFIYFAGLAGASLAILTPDLWTPFPSYPAIYYFAVHGLIVITAIVMLWGCGWRPRPGCLLRVFAVVNLFAAAVGAFNQWFGTNYMYLCKKPASATLLDWFGPWPVYIAVGELFALALFALLWLPFRRAAALPFERRDR